MEGRSGSMMLWWVRGVEKSVAFFVKKHSGQEGDGKKSSEEAVQHHIIMSRIDKNQYSTP